MKCILFIVSLIVITALPVQVNGQEAGIPPMQRVELAKAQIKNDPAAAADAFSDILKGKNKKNADLLIAIGYAYLENEKADMATDYLNRAMELNNKYAPTYVFAGDIALAAGDVGEACSKYEQAIYFDFACKEAYLKYAQAYANVNPALAVDMLLKLKAQDSSYLSADKELGSIYYFAGEYGKAKESYENYFAGGQPDMKDLINYGMVLFLAKDYTKSLDMVKKGLIKDPENHLLKRLAMYDSYELKLYDDGLKAAERFFVTPNDPNYVYLDYLYYARILVSLKQNDKAIERYQMALKKEPGKVEIWKELSDIYGDLKDYDKAIESYNNYMKVQQEPDAADLFPLGRLYYYAGNAVTDSMPNSRAKKKELLVHADSVFSIVAAKVPDNYLGSFWRARTNSLLDPETTAGLAKPYYEAALAILEAKPDASKSLIVECDSYLGYYYFVKNDFQTSKIYWNKILVVDPENQTAKQALEGIK